jgi:hypothetical protein
MHSLHNVNEMNPYVYGRICLSISTRDTRFNFNDIFMDITQLEATSNPFSSNS